MEKLGLELAIAVIDKARRVRETFEAQAPKELLVAHHELADALDAYDDRRVVEVELLDGVTNPDDMKSPGVSYVGVRKRTPSPSGNLFLDA